MRWWGSSSVGSFVTSFVRSSLRSFVRSFVTSSLRHFVRSSLRSFPCRRPAGGVVALLPQAESQAQSAYRRAWLERIIVGERRQAGAMRVVCHVFVAVTRVERALCGAAVIVRLKTGQGRCALAREVLFLDVFDSWLDIFA